MKKLLYPLFLCASLFIFAQQSKKSTFVLIDGIISSNKMMNKMVPQKEIEKVNVYKTKANVPQNLKNFENYSENGLIDLKLKKGANYYDKISLAELNEQFKIAKENPVLFDDYLIADTKIMIYGNILEQMEVKMIDGKQVLRISSSKN